MNTLKDFGYTDGCRQCDHIRAFGEVRGGLPHSERCRARIVKAMGETEKGMVKLKEVNDRLDKALMEHVPAQAAEPPGAPPVRPSAVQAAGPSGASSSRSSDPPYLGVRGGMSLPADEAQSAETPVPRPSRDSRTGLSSVAPRAAAPRPPGDTGIPARRLRDAFAAPRGPPRPRAP